MKDFWRFGSGCVAELFRGGWRYYAWMTALLIVSLAGLNAYAKQLVYGLAVTGMSDQVSWGIYIANFTFLVGVAAAAVMLVIPVYVYRDKTLKDMVILGELLAVTAIVMCLLFVTVDLGRPERALHMAPGFGTLNFPQSMLSWDVIVLNVYLVLNVHITGYLLYKMYLNKKPTWFWYIPFVFLSMGWAISIHTVTAFLYVGLGGRPFWASAIVAPRFLASAFTSGPGIIILTAQVIRRVRGGSVTDTALLRLRSIVQVAMILNVFLLFCEVFKEFYAETPHSMSARYLFFGIHGHSALVPWIWTAVGLNSAALVLLVLPASRSLRYLNIACVFAIVGIWIEKGMGLVIPGFVPTPLGEIVEYRPSLNEALIAVGIWAFGAMMYTGLVKMVLPVLEGRRLHAESA